MLGRGRLLKTHTVYKTMLTPERRAFVSITEDVQRAVDEADIREGMVLVSARPSLLAPAGAAAPIPH